MRRAYRRPVADADLKGPMALYREGRSEGDFDAGIEAGLERRAREPANSCSAWSWTRTGVAAGAGLSHQRSRAGVAAVVLPVEQHPGRGTARRGRFEARSAGRTCSSGRSAACSPTRARRTSRAISRASGSRLRNLESVDPNVRLFPDFDDNLRQAFRQETELFVDSILREDRSVLDLLKADYTFLNERLAKHYGIPARLRQPVSARGARARQRARRTAAARQHPDGHVVCDADVAGDARHVGPRQHLRRAAPPPPAERAGARRQHRCPPACRCGSGWARIAPTRRARAVTERSTRSGSRWRTSTPSAAGGITTETAGRSTCPAACPAAASSAAWPASKTAC